MEIPVKVRLEDNLDFVCVGGTEDEFQPNVLIELVTKSVDWVVRITVVVSELEEEVTCGRFVDEDIEAEV